jgi:NADH dehydrogenase/NADH:ubiquinone oxidoreductase subunit G
MSTVSITINDTRIQAQLGVKILEAALNAGIHIPYACFEAEADPPVKGCKLCYIELNGNVVNACAEPVAEGMVIKTNTAEVERLRRSRMQFPG